MGRVVDRVIDRKNYGGTEGLFINTDEDGWMDGRILLVDRGMSSMEEEDVCM